MVMMLLLDFALGIMIYYWRDEYFTDSLISTLSLYFLFAANFVSFLTKVFVYRMFVKLRPIVNLAVLRREIKLVFGKQIYHYSILFTGVSMISHLIALIISCKWFFRRPLYDIQVDKHLMRYCLIFYIRLGYSYYRYRKYFKQTEKKAEFNLKSFEYVKEQPISELGDSKRKKSEQGEFCVICQIEYEEGDKLASLDCGNRHWYHVACIKGWLERSATCPLCREEIYRDESLHNSEKEE